jgi:hypothetical protein
MIARALWVGTNLGCSCPEFVIIPENANESKGLLKRLVTAQGLERTGFFAEKRHMSRRRLSAPAPTIPSSWS